ncbi:MAG: putative toxin-antitoxin system toxin component, PIN family [Microscillaceae bacterium]|nr:putative toxin-antitoxin system toxin component, PIN family [Microscillaceae bacterium]
MNNEILTEYEEIISQKANASIATEVLDMLITLPNTIETLIYYRWQLIQEDEDDDKFVDTAIAGQADYLITHDRHFNILKNIDFPKIPVVSLEEFKEIIMP